MDQALFPVEKIGHDQILQTMVHFFQSVLFQGYSLFNTVSLVGASISSEYPENYL